MKEKTKSYNAYAKYSGMAFQMILVIVLGIWAGRSLDGWTRVPFPVFTVIFSLLSVIGVMVLIIKSLPKY